MMPVMVRALVCLMVAPACSVTELGCLRWRGEEQEMLGPTSTLGTSLATVPTECISEPGL